MEKTVDFKARQGYSKNCNKDFNKIRWSKGGFSRVNSPESWNYCLKWEIPAEIEIVGQNQLQSR